MSTETKKQIVVLQTSDEEQYSVEKNVAERSVMIKSMIDGESRSSVVVSRDQMSSIRGVIYAISLSGHPGRVVDLSPQGEGHQHLGRCRLHTLVSLPCLAYTIKSPISRRHTFEGYSA